MRQEGRKGPGPAQTPGHLVVRRLDPTSVPCGCRRAAESQDCLCGKFGVRPWQRAKRCTAFAEPVPQSGVGVPHLGWCLPVTCVPGPADGAADRLHRTGALCGHWGRRAGGPGGGRAWSVSVSRAHPPEASGRRSASLSAQRVECASSHSGGETAGSGPSPARSPGCLPAWRVSRSSAAEAGVNLPGPGKTTSQSHVRCEPFGS